MKVVFKDEWFDEVKKFLDKDEARAIEANYHYSTGRGRLKVDISNWSDETLQKLFDYLGLKADAGDRSAKMSQTIVRQWREIKSDPDGQSVGRLENVEPAMKRYIGSSKHRYLFEQRSDGNFVPWFVSYMRYQETSVHNPAMVVVTLNAVNSGRGNNNRSSGVGEFILRIGIGDIRKRTMSQILEKFGYYLETPARMESFKKEVETYLKSCDVDGLLMSVVGKAELIRGWYHRSYRSVGSDGRPAKMVIDPPDLERGTDSLNSPYWNEKEDVVWQVPAHPVFEMFDLDEHADYRVHVNNAELYVYDDKVDQKLVLPEDVKDFLAVLIEHSKNNFKDIVGGKEGGTIVLIEGAPGIGKTLTAEVYSEKMHRPLYKVQSSQLGTSLQIVEEQLQEVLQRSERWGAILLIDEADVYVRERGTDIHQNAIVGVFLRVLEYYRGVLFMTTNIGKSVDDAIISRTTARFIYETPNEEDQKKLWAIMSEQNNVILSKEQIDLIVEQNPRNTGRDIKNLMKLAMVAAMSKGGVVTPDLIKFVSRFKQSGTANK